MRIRRASRGRGLSLTIAVLLAHLFLRSGVNAQVQQASADQLFQRDGFTWRASDTEHFRIYCEPGTPADRQLRELTKQAEQYFVRVLDLLGERSKPMRIHVFLVDSRARMKDLVGFETNGIAFRETLVLCNIVSDTFSSFHTHEMMHLASTTLWGWDKRKPEAWINEGLAVYAGDHWHGLPLHAVAKYLRVNKKLIPLRRLIGNFRKYPGDVPRSVESGQRFRSMFYATCSFVSTTFLLTSASSAVRS